MRSWPCSSPARLSSNIAYIIYRIEKTEPTRSSVYAPQVGLEPTTTRLTAECSAIELLRNIGKRSISTPLSFGIRRRPTLPGRVQPSTIGAEGLNFCVRYGNRWYPFAIITGNCELCLCLRLLSNNIISLAQLPKPVNSFVQKYSKNPNSE